MQFPGPARAMRHIALACLFVLCAAPGGSHAADTNVRKLAELPLDALLDMEVTGPSRFSQRRSQSASSVTVISAQEIRAFGWKTLGEALSSVKGLVVANDHSYAYLGVRGFFAQGDYNTRVLLLVDGNRINENVYDMAFLGTEFPLDLDLVERIEFIPGQGSAVYGANALFGVVNVITRESSRHGLEATLSTGTGHFDTLRVGGTRRLGAEGSLLVSASRTRATGPEIYLAEHDAPPARNGLAHNTFEHRDSLYLRADGGPWRATLVHSDRLKGAPAYLDFAFDDPRSYYRDIETLLDVGLEREIAQRTRGQVRWFIGRYTFEGEYALESTPVINREEATGQWWGVDTRLLSTRWENHTLVAGVEFQRASREGMKNFDLDAARTTYWDLATPSSRTSFYAEDQMTLAKPLSLTVGSRFDHGTDGTHEWNPRLAVHWTPRPEFVAKLIFGSAYRPSAVADQVYAPQRLRNETVKGRELAIEWQLDSRRRASLSWYHNEARHLITGGLDADTLVWINRNLGRLLATGQEFEYEQRFTFGATLRANLTLQHAHDTGELPIAQYAPRRIGNVLLALPAGSDWTLGLNANGASRRGQAAGYGLLHLTLSQRLPERGAALSFGVRDVFDRRPDDPGNDPVLQPRIAQVGRTWSARLDLRY